MWYDVDDMSLYGTWLFQSIRLAVIISITSTNTVYDDVSLLCICGLEGVLCVFDDGNV